MYILAELYIQSYKPKQLSKGMLFFKWRTPFAQLWELNEIPRNQEEFLKENGHPVEYSILDMNENLLASCEEIGWMDEGEYTDELREVTLEDINLILQKYEGYVEIDVKEEDELTPNYQQEKVIIRFQQ